MSSARCWGNWQPNSLMSGGYATDLVMRLETNLDDLSPEIAGAVMDRLFAAGKGK